MSRLILVFAFVLGAASYGTASERATFILTDGERQSGTVVFHTNTRENLIDGDFSLGRDDGGRELILHASQVAVIDFSGGQPAPTELAQLPPAGQLIVMRDGTAQPGRFVNMIGGDTLLWDSQSGQRQQFPISSVSRVYLNPQSARTVFNYAAPTTAVGTSGAAAGSDQSRTVTVDAKQPWTDTGITVNRGDHVVFHASGQIQFGRSPGQTADANGAAQRSPNYPDPTVPVGALLGRIGNGAPFAIGMQTQPLPMPASGRLMLGVNDNELGDNSGAFTVTVTKQ